MRGFLLIIVLPIILAFVSFPFLTAYITCYGLSGVGNLGCIFEGMVYTFGAFIIFMILGVILNSWLKNKEPQKNNNESLDLNQIKEEKYSDIIRYYTESDEEHKKRKLRKWDFDKTL